jgi:transposase
MKTLSLDLRERILTAYDAGAATRETVAGRFRVSLGMVKKLLQQRRRIGGIGPQHHRAGRKPRILPAHRAQLRRQLAAKPDLTLAELRAATGLDCTLPAIHYVLADLGLTFKKRRSGRASRTGRTLSERGGGGGAAKAASTRPGWSSSTSRPRRRT